MKAQASFQTVIIALVVGFLAGRWSDGTMLTLDVAPIFAPHVPSVNTKATAVTFVYEKDDHAVPSPVLAAFNRLNREQGIVATLLEADPQDGTGEVPDQYKTALTAAKEAGLPALVITAGDKVLKIVSNPKTEAAVLEAIQ